MRSAVRCIATCSAACARTRVPTAMRVRESELRRDIARLERQLRDADKRAEVERHTRDLPPLDDATLDAIYLEVMGPEHGAEAARIAAPPTASAAIEELATQLGVSLAVPADAAADTPGQARHAAREAILNTIAKSGESGERGERGVVAAYAWSALAAQSARDGDHAQVERVITLAQQRGAAVAPLFHRVMDVYASEGRVDDVLRLSAAMEAHGIAPSAATKHVVTKAYAHMNQLHDAVQYLAFWERSEPAPMASYTLVLEHVLKHPLRDIHPIAWSLFYHMRYAAHAVPDAPMYALMIRACAAGVPQPTTMAWRRRRACEADAERALDLFREMTVHHGLKPTKTVYDNLILTCARRKEHYGDALRLLRELMDGGAHGTEPLRPDAYTYNAVLQGSARRGDLATARWILADLVRTAMAGGGSGSGANEETMSNVFWTYAVYKPPLKRRDLAAAQAGTSAGAGPDAGSDADGTDVAHGGAARPSFTHALPQTASEVLTEARALMARVLADQGGEPQAHPLASVRVTPRMLNAYVAVLTHHLRPEQRLRALVNEVEGPDGVFAQARVEPNGHTWACVLAECAAAKDRELADAVAARAWAAWERLEAAHPRADAKLVSQVWAHMIRHHAKSFRVQEGLEMLRAFFAKYPPSKRNTPEMDALAAAQPPLPAMDWTPIVPPPSMQRVFAALPPAPRSAADTYAPLAPLRPKLLFRDLELLHHRCVALRNVPGLNLITRVDREYRREW